MLVATAPSPVQTADCDTSLVVPYVLHVCEFSVQLNFPIDIVGSAINRVYRSRFRRSGVGGAYREMQPSSRLLVCPRILSRSSG
jgi:hypothetical protein